MRTLTVSLLTILVFALLAGCNRDPVAPDLAEPGTILPAADETPSGLSALIDRLESEGALPHGPATSLRSHLKDAVKFEERGDTDKADRVYDLMISKVGQWVAEGTIRGDAADELTSHIGALLANKYIAISAGGEHSCGLRPNGDAFCWGRGGEGQRGDGTPSNSKIPVKVLGGHTFASISAGGYHTCGITPPVSGRDPGGVAYCWGLNSVGQQGDGTFSDKYVPVKVAGHLAFASISAGDFHTCGITTAGKAYCWGNNESGQLGRDPLNETVSGVPVEVAGGLTFSSITAGVFHTCGLTTAGKAFCWGGNKHGQFGDGTNVDSAVPVAVLAPEGTTFASIEAGAVSGTFEIGDPVGGITCAVTTAGKAYCWGRNRVGGLGDGTNVDSNVPVEVAGGLTFASIEAGFGTSCGVTTAGAGYCWGGSSGSGGPSGDSNVPVPVAGGHTFASISVGTGHACGVTTAGTGYCWGENFSGEVGAGKNKACCFFSPVKVASP